MLLGHGSHCNCKAVVQFCRLKILNFHTIHHINYLRIICACSVVSVHLSSPIIMASVLYVYLAKLKDENTIRI